MEDSHIVEISNPLTFINKQYLDNFLLEKYPKATYEFYMINGLPKTIDIILGSLEEANSLITQYNSKFFEKAIN